MKFELRLAWAIASLVFAISAQGSYAATELPSAAAAQVKAGAYVAQLGDCVACHSAADGAPLAGGRELLTPFGKIYSTNITPDKNTGIGSYSFAQFDRAMRKGVAADRHQLYPAMPYPSYSRMAEADMRSLFAFLQQGVAPVARANKPSDMHWPFSMRWGLALWNYAFLDNTLFAPDASQGDSWNRGAYPVQGLGHCGSCHTPRGLAFQEKAMSEASSSGMQYLAGETVENWRALSLRDLWTVDDTVQLLRTGRNRFATVSGNMTEVIQHSTQHFTDDDLRAVAVYLKALPAADGGKPRASAAPIASMAAKLPEALYKSRGGLGYVQFCVDCHRLDGTGVADIFPPMAQNPAILADDPATLLHVVLTGARTAQTASHPRVMNMPSFAQLSDNELGEILNFVRASWGSKTAPEISTSDVKKMRESLSPKVAPHAGFDTPRLANMLDRPNAEQLVRGMRLHLETKALLPDHVGGDLNCTSCHLNAGTVANGSPFVGVSAFFPSYVPRSGRIISLADRINGCFKRSMNGKPLPVDAPDMKAMEAYLEWMKGETKPGDKVAGRGVGKMDTTLVPNTENGKRIYGEQCALCHGKDGEGLKSAAGNMVYPPLWGEQSFNIGAGLARTFTAAAFVKQNMPIGLNAKFPLGQGGLSDQKAVDVAEYFSHMPRPDFPDKAKDWPKDKKPADARY